MEHVALESFISIRSVLTPMSQSPIQDSNLFPVGSRLTLEAETAAAQYRQEIAKGMISEWTFSTERARPSHISLGGTFLSILSGVVGKRDRCFQLSNILSKHSNSKALRLRKCPSPSAHMQHSNPPTVLIEYIRDTTLENYNAAMRPNIPSAIFRPLLDAIRKFKGLVYHGDVSGSNILVSSSEAPARVVLIDFGRAGVREDGKEENNWTSICELYNNVDGLAWALKANGVPWL